MQTTERRYLPLLTDDCDGHLIPWPEFMVLAVLSDPERDGMQQTYEAMVREQELRPDASAEGITNLGRVVRSRVIEGDTTGRVLAGAVVLELVHIAVASDKPPTVGKARLIVGSELEEAGVQRQVRVARRNRTQGTCSTPRDTGLVESIVDLTILNIGGSPG